MDHVAVLRWSRPYESPDLVGGYVLLVGVSGFTMVTGCVGVLTRHHLAPSLPPVGGVLIVVWVVIWRWVRTGLFVGDDGVLVRWMWRSRTIGWTDIGSFSVAPYPVLGVDGDHRGLWIVCGDGSMVKTPVMLEPRRWGYSNIRGFSAHTALKKAAFAELMADLRRMHAWSMGEDAGDDPTPTYRPTGRIRPKSHTRRRRRR